MAKKKPTLEELNSSLKEKKPSLAELNAGLKKKDDGTIPSDLEEGLSQDTEPSATQVEPVEYKEGDLIDEGLLNEGETTQERKLRVALETATQYSTDPTEMAVEKMQEHAEQGNIRAEHQEKLKTDSKYHSEHFNKQIDKDVEEINKGRVVEGKTPISRESEIKYRESDYVKTFLRDETDQQSYQIKNRLEEINQEVASLDNTFSEDGPYKNNTPEEREMLKNLDQKNLGEEYNKIEQQGKKFEEERIENIDSEITELAKQLKEDPSDKALSDRIRLLNSQKENFFKDIKTNTDNLVAKAGITPSEDKSVNKATFDAYYDGLYQEFKELGQNPLIQASKGNKGLPMEVLSNVAIASTLGDSDDVQRYSELGQILEEYAPIRILNRYSTGETESVGFVEGAKRFGETFTEGLTSSMTPAKRKSQLAETQKLATDMIGLGIPLNENVKTSARIDEKGQFGEYGLTEPEFAGEMIGISGGIMVQMAGNPIKGGAIVKNAKLINSTKALRALASKPILSKLFRFSTKAIQTGAEYQSAGLVFRTNKDELNFVSGLFGSVGEQGVGAVVKKISPVLSKWFSREGKNKFVEAVSKFGNKAQTMTGKGLGEVGEEFMQEVSSIYTNDNVEFFDGLEKRFGTLDKSSKFIVSSFVMGAFMNIGSKMNKASNDKFIKEFKELQKTNPEQAKIVSEITKELTNEFGSAMDESVDPKKVAEEEARLGVEEVEIEKPTDTDVKVDGVVEAESIVKEEATPIKEQAETTVSIETEQKKESKEESDVVKEENYKGEVDEETHKDMSTSTELNENKTQQTEVANLAERFNTLTTREKSGSKGAKLINDIKNKGKEFGYEVNVAPKNDNIRVTKDGKDVKSYQTDTDITRDENYKSPKQRKFNDQSNRLLGVFMEDTSIMKGTGDNFSDSELKGIVSDLKGGKPTRRATRLLDRIQKFGESGKHEMLTDSKAEKGIWSGGPLEDMLTDYESEINRKLQEDVQQELLEAEKSGDATEVKALKDKIKELEAKETTTTESKQTKPKTESKQSQEDDGGKKPPVDGKKMADNSASNDGKKKFFLSMIDQMDIPDKVKQQLNDNIDRAIITNKEAKQIADEYISRLDTPMEALEAVKGFGSELLQASVGVEVLNTLREEQTRLKENGANIDDIVKSQADIYEVIEGLQDKGADSGRAIQYLSKAKFATSEEALIEVQKRKQKKLNDIQMEMHNVSQITEKDTKNIINDVLEETEVIKKLKQDIKDLQKKLEKSQEGNETIKKERAKIRKAKTNINKLFDTYKNTKDGSANSTFIPGLTAKETQLAYDVAKEYLKVVGSEVTILAEEIRIAFKDNLGKDLNVEDLEKLASEVIETEKEQEATTKEKKILKEAKALETSIDSVFEDILLGKADSSALVDLLEGLGLDKKEASKYATRIQKKLNKSLKESIEKRIETKLKGSKVNRKKKVAKSIAESIVIGQKLDVDLTDLIKASYNEEFGILDLSTKEFNDKLAEHVAKIILTPDGSKMRENAEAKMMDWINSHQKANYGNILKSMYYANMLSHYNTHINNIGFGIWTALGEYTNNAFLGLFQKHKRLANKEFRKSIGVSWTIAREEYLSDVGGEGKYDIQSMKDSKLKRPNDFKKSWIGGKFMFGYLNGVLKILGAQDGYFTTMIASGQLVKEMYTDALNKEMELSPDGKVSKSRRKELLSKLTDNFNDESYVNDSRKQANKDVQKANELESLLMVEEKGKMVLSEKYKSLPSKERNRLVRDYKVRVHEILQNKIDKEGLASKRAFEYAKDVILSGQPTGTAGIIYHAILNSPIAKSPVIQFLTIPFVKVPVNSGKLIVDKAPVLNVIYHSTKMIGLLKNKYYRDSISEISESTLGLFFPKSYLETMNIESGITDRRMKQITKRMIASNAIAFSLLSLMALDDDEDERGIKSVIDFTGGMKGDWRKNQTLKDAKGLEPYSVYIFGDFAFSYLYTPYAGSAFYMGSVRDTERGHNEFDNESIVSKYIMTSFMAGDLALEQTAMTQMSGIIEGTGKMYKEFMAKKSDRIDGDEESNLSKALKIPMKGLMKNLQTGVPASGLIKGTYTDTKAIFDMPNKQAVEGFDFFTRGFPFLEMMLEDKTDFLGRGVVGNVDLGSFRLGRESKYEYALMLEAGFDVTNIQFYTTRIIKNPITEKTVELTKQQLSELNRYIKKERVKNFNFREWDNSTKGSDDRKSELKSEMKDAHKTSNADGIWNYFEKEYK